MKINDSLFELPLYLPNDLEGFSIFYPNKFPPIADYFKQLSRKIAVQPKSYAAYGEQALLDLRAGFEKISRDFENSNQSDLRVLVETNLRLQKLTCYRFWIINYVFPDGPFHQYYTDILKKTARRIADPDQDDESYEKEVQAIERDLMQSDYADLYLEQAINGKKLLDLLRQHVATKRIISATSELIAKKEKPDTIHAALNPLIKKIQTDKTDLGKNARSLMRVPLNQAALRESLSPIYSMLMSMLEFETANEQLIARYNENQIRLNTLFKQAHATMPRDEFAQLKLAYEQIRNFTAGKDVMGEFDLLLLPMLSKIHKMIYAELSKSKTVPVRPAGQAAIFYYYVWHLPPELQALIMTPDVKPFTLKTL